MSLDELRKLIIEKRAHQAGRQEYGVPAGVQLGTLTSTIRDGAGWTTTDQFPSHQTWADEVERVLSFAHAKGQFEHYLPRLRSNARQRSAALTELRVAFFLSRNEFPVVEWEPIGANNREGEFTIMTPIGEKIFVEVKSPTWESELSDEEKTSGRKELGKYIHLETRPIAPWQNVQYAVNNAYGKFRSDTPNLLIIADDLFVSLEYGTEMQAAHALYSPRHGGHFTTASKENLGGVGFFWVKNNLMEVSYEMKLFLNPHALPSVILPGQFTQAFNASDRA
jgi:hypothetical protein